jgi:hypothetical protein
MSRQLNPAQIWSQAPLANRTASVIKSIQTGTISFVGANVISGTATITAVTVAKSVCIFNGQTRPGGNTFMCSMTLTNTTTVTFSTQGDNGSSYTATGAYTVVEFY